MPTHDLVIEAPMAAAGLKGLDFLRVADLPEVAGTVAGDDVVLVVAREPCSGADILELCDRIGAEAAHAHA